MSLGFVAMGVSVAEPLPEHVRSYYQKELAQKGVGDMTYLLRNEEVRFDPSRLVEGARSVLVFAFNYFPPIRQESVVPQVAYFAYGKDYHRVVKDKLYLLIEKLRLVVDEPIAARPFVDSAPLAERYWAEQAGVGRKGRHSLIIVPRYGSFCFLGEIVTTLELPPDKPLKGSPCGRCMRCVEACPAKAIQPDGGFIPTRCISYQTIERRSDFAETEAVELSEYLFGCDICQKVCPHNQALSPHSEEAFMLPEHLRKMDAEAWRAMTKEQFETLFEGTPLLRSGHKGILRNLDAHKEGGK